MRHKYRWLASMILLVITLLAHADLLPPVSPQVIAQLYNPQHNTIAGNPKGNVTLVEFFDYNCGYCRSMNQVIKGLIKNNPDLRVVYKEYLLFGQSSELATRAALAATQQGKYLVFRNALMSAAKPLDYNEIMRLARNTGLNTNALANTMKSSAITSQIAENTLLPESLGIAAAPAFVISNSKILQVPRNKSIKQYVYIGSEDAKQNLPKLIEQARKG